MKNFLTIMFCMYGFFANSSEVKHQLIIDTKTVNFSGKEASAMAINGSIPGPTLEFTQGDVAVIDVINNTDDEASIHWHGLLLPQEQDGVPYLTMFPIEAGTSYQYRFPLSHPGTYWYHSHTKIDEQKGQYGAIIVHPKEGYSEKVQHDVVVQLSDWTDEDPYDVLKNLKKDGDWYGYKKDSVISIDGYLENSDLSAWFDNRWQRMEGMDVSDVGYDAFLANGKTNLALVPNANIGDKVRLRLINSGASSIFDIARGDEYFKVVAADGVDVKPINVKTFRMAMAETYDVIVTIPPSGAMEFSANNIDGTGGVNITLGSGEKVRAPLPIKPNLFGVMDHSSGHGSHGSGHGNHGHDSSQHNESESSGSKHSSSEHSSSKHGAHSSGAKVEESKQKTEQKDNQNKHQSHHMHHGHHQMDHQMDQEMNHGVDVKQPEIEILDTLDYKMLKSEQPVVHKGEIQEFTLELTGDMESYNWSFNNQPLSKADVLKIERGNVVRFHFVNKTMMNHPLHLHGHFFKVLSGNGDNDVIKHTVNVAPMANVSIEFAANEYKDWFFHCHNLYHAKTGMSRVVRYSDYQGNPDFTAAKMMSDEIMDSDWYSRSDVNFFSNHAALGFRYSNYDHVLEFEGERHFSEQHNEFELHYNYRSSRWLQYFVGVESESAQRQGIENEAVENERRENHLQVGVKYVLPFSIETTTWLNDEGEINLAVETEFQLTKHIGFEIELSTESEWEYNFEYRQSPRWSIALNHNNISGIGLGVTSTF